MTHNSRTCRKQTFNKNHNVAVESRAASAFIVEIQVFGSKKNFGQAIHAVQLICCFDYPQFGDVASARKSERGVNLTFSTLILLQSKKRDLESRINMWMNFATLWRQLGN